MAFGPGAKPGVLSHKSPFREVSAEEKAEIAKKQAKLAEQAKSTLDSAERCFRHPDFVKYRQDYEKLERESVDFLISYTKTGSYNIEDYAFVVKSIIQDIAHYRQFLESVRGEYEKAERSVRNAGKERQ